MLRAAVAAVQEGPYPVKLLAVTVLTSMDARELATIGVAADPAHQVARLGQLAASCGIDGLVCSPREAPELRALLPGSHLVTPGIRAGGSVPPVLDDQQRVSTPSRALRDGASQLVVGRPITAAADPAQAYLNILKEMSSAFQT